MQFMTNPPRNNVRRGRTQQGHRVKKSNLQGPSTHTVNVNAQEPSNNYLNFIQQNADDQDTQKLTTEPNSNNNFFSVNVNMNINLNLQTDNQGDKTMADHVKDSLVSRPQGQIPEPPRTEGGARRVSRGYGSHLAKKLGMRKSNKNYYYGSQQRTLEHLPQNHVYRQKAPASSFVTRSSITNSHDSLAKNLQTLVSLDNIVQ